VPAKKPRQDQMTPAMDALGYIGAISRDVKAAQSIADVLLIDAAENAWAEGHSAYALLETQHKKPSDRAVFYTRLGRRGIDTSEGRGNRAARRGIEQSLPGYLKDPEVAAIAADTAEILGRLQALATKRARQYPNAHARVLKAIEERSPATADDADEAAAS
jgi:hypothetical protein